MAVLIDIEKLAHQLWRTGPYIYFYDGKYGRINQEYLKYIDELALKYKKLKVFKVDWNNKITFQPLTPLSEMKKIYLYFEGVKKEEKTITDREILNSIFGKAILYYNKFIDLRLKNIGTKQRKNHCSYGHLSPAQFQKVILKNEQNIKNYRTCLIRSKINIEKEDFSKFPYIRNDYSVKEKVMTNHISRSPVVRIMNKTFVDKNKNINGIQKYKNSSWYNDATISDLPIEILSNENDKKPESENINSVCKCNNERFIIELLQSNDNVEKFTKNNLNSKTSIIQSPKSPK